jgi:hypothetical protein
VTWQGEGEEELMRSAIQVDLSPADVRRMLLSYGKVEMKEWVEMVDSTRIVKVLAPFREWAGICRGVLTTR